jgi:hypothetical protein
MEDLAAGEGMDELGGDVATPGAAAPAPGESAAGEVPGAEGDDSSLLAAPARVEDNPTDKSLEPQAKGKKYHARKEDRRKINKDGPTKRHMRSTAGVRPARRTQPSRKDTFPGYEISTGHKNINKLYEEYEPIYRDEEETQLLENTKDIRKLISQMEQKEAEIKKSEKQTQ